MQGMKSFLGSAAAFFLTIGLLIGTSGADAQTSVQEQPSIADSASARVAKRLQQRVVRRFERDYSIQDLTKAVEERMNLMKRKVTVTLVATNAPASLDPLSAWTVSLQQYPHWVSFQPDGKPRFAVDDRAIRASLLSNASDVLPQANFATVSGFSDTYVTRAHVMGTPNAGYAWNVKDASSILLNALEHDLNEASIAVNYEEPKLFVIEDDKITELTLLATGRSNFEQSPGGRIQNIQKALTDHVHTAVIEPGDDFSFNLTLLNPMSGRIGWADAWVIIDGGKDLVLEPGGGICQVATTFYRAALLAGLPIVKRANHSLYVSYYKKYGVGADAAVYQGKQDLVINNDTKEKIIVLSRTEGDEAIVELYGVPDGRQVAMEGPFFRESAPQNFHPDGRDLYTNEIGWKRIVEFSDGTTKQETILSRYLAMPKNLHAEYPVSRGKEELLGTYVAAATGSYLLTVR